MYRLTFYEALIVDRPLLFIKFKSDLTLVNIEDERPSQMMIDRRRATSLISLNRLSRMQGLY